MTASVEPASVRVLGGPDLEALLTYDWCIEALERVMRSVSAGGTVLPLRTYMEVAGGPGRLALMPGSLLDPACFGVKVVSKFPPEVMRIGGSHAGMVVLFDAQRGIPAAVMDGAVLTAVRTAAVTALATRVLARRSSAVLALLGCGEQARRHVQALSHVMRIERLIIWGRSRNRAEAFLEWCRSALPSVLSEVALTADAAAQAADVICTVTSASEPFLHGRLLRKGCHVNLVGAAVRASAEADIEVVERSRFFVDYRPSALAQAGELNNAIEAGRITASHIAGELGELLLGRVPGRTSDDEITVFKSVGIAAQDLAIAHGAAERAVTAGCGTVVRWS